MFIITNTKTKDKWRKKHIENIAMAKKLWHVGLEARAARMYGCGSRIEVQRCEECGEVIFKKAQLCRDRLCPTCAWRLAMKRFAEMMAVFEHIFGADYGTKRTELKATLLTLTVKNVPINAIRETCDGFSTAWKRVAQSKAFTSRVKGYARSLEITVNQRTLQAHPHLHVLIIWGKDEDGDKFRERMRKAWRKHTGIDYDPIIDVRDAYSKDGEEDSPTRIALEAFKYAVKPSSFENIPMKEFAEFAGQIKGLRFISYSGLIAQVRRELKFVDETQPSEEIKDVVIDDGACNHHWTEALAIWSNVKQDYIGVELGETCADIDNSGIGLFDSEEDSGTSDT